MNNSLDEMMYCPVEEEKVDVRSVCGDCELWDGRRCCFGHDSRATVRTLRGRLSSLRRMKSPRRGGRGLHVPPVWEKWSMTYPLTEDVSLFEDEIEFGVAGMLPAEMLDVPEEKVEEFKLPELIKEEWEVQPDVPDWGPGPQPKSMPEPVQPPGLFPEDPLPNLLPPGPGEIPGMESPQDIIPGFPPDPFNKPMP